MMNSCVRSAKAKVRDEMKKQIASISSLEQEKQSSIVVKRLLNMPLYQNSKRISIYLSMKGEIQTDKIVENILASGKECFIPRYTKNEMAMVKLFSMQDLNTLPLTKWNIRQPLVTDEREDAMKSGLDLLIVPGLAFTAVGERLGRGKGYYDRFQEEYYKTKGTKLQTIGLAFQQQILSSLPTDKNDFKLDTVIFPECNQTDKKDDTSN